MVFAFIIRTRTITRISKVVCHYFSLSLQNGTCCYNNTSLSSFAEEVPLAQSLSQRTDAAIDNYADVAMSIPRI